MEGFLRAAGFDVEGFASGAALLAAPRGGADCVVLDLEMPGQDGLEVQRLLARHEPHLPVLFLSGRAALRSGVAAMREGAVDFLEKPFDGAQLLAAVGVALERGRGAREAAAARDEARGRVARLTPSELRVCRLVAEGLLNKQIAAVVGVSEQTVKVHRGRAMRKLGARSVPDVVRLLEASR